MSRFSANIKVDQLIISYINGENDRQNAANFLTFCQYIFICHCMCTKKVHAHTRS